MGEVEGINREWGIGRTDRNGAEGRDGMSKGRNRRKR
jgi:hypothetical protein